MIKIRAGIFETNSSSTHSIVICTKKQFDEWKAGKILFDPYNETFTNSFTEEQENEVRRSAADTYNKQYSYSKFHRTWNELTEEAREEFIQSKLSQLKPSGYTALNYEDYKYYHKEGCEYSEKHYKTEHGDELVVFGKGGYD